MNPKVTNVFSALEKIQRSEPRAVVTIKGTIPFPDWDGPNDHIQGVAPKNGTASTTGCIAGSSSDGAYLASFEGDRVRAVSIWPDRPEDFDHAGGVQMLGNFLPLDVESDEDADKAAVGMYDLANLSSPNLRYRFSMPGRKASASAITNFTDGSREKALLALYEYDPRYMLFYLADYDALGGTSNPFTKIYRYTGNVFDGDQYQNFAMVTSTDDTIYLLGFRENEELHVFEVLSSKNPFTITGIVRRATYTDWSGSDWRYGVGAQIVDASTIRIFGTDKDPEGDDDDYRFKLYLWW